MNSETTEKRRTYTGHVRIHKTRWSVRTVDIFSRTIITVGGIGTIIAVCTVFVFLVWVVIPLFLPSTIKTSQNFQKSWGAEEPIFMEVDEYKVMGWVLSREGTLDVFRLDNGKVLEKKQLFEGKLTAHWFSIDGNHAAFGFENGAIQAGEIGFQTSFYKSEEVPEEIRTISQDELAEWKGGLVQKTPGGQFRLSRLHVSLEKSVSSASESPVLLISQAIRPAGPMLCILSSDGKLRAHSIRKRENLLTGEVTTTLTGAELPFELNPEDKPAYLLLTGFGDHLYVIWRDGRLLRYNLHNLYEPREAERLDLVEEPNGTVTCVKLMTGGKTIIVGDSLCRVRSWFNTKPENAQTPDGVVLAKTRGLAATEAPVASIAVSSRTRIFAAGYEDGSARIFQLTTGQMLASVQLGSQERVQLITITPKDDGLFAMGAHGIWGWNFDAKHPESTLKALFLPVWYEGYSEPRHVWQSSSATDDFEPKLGMMPLVFGTIKATLYSLLFGLPVALLAAIYTSEFLHPDIKAKIKPTIEMMASLPSVVLGFLAALVFAPFVERAVPSILSAAFTIPLAFLFGAYLWQIIPSRITLRLSRRRTLFISIMLPIGLIMAFFLGPILEQFFFAGDIKSWLDGQSGGPSGGWVLLFLPACTILVAIFKREIVNSWMDKIVAPKTKEGHSLLQFAKFLVAAAITLAGAKMVSLFLVQLGLDPRGNIVGTYVQRNAMVVGFVMGFAIIPIIYTIAEDALSSVPRHLRSASLASGATPWQTAQRIIIPTAMSGLFSAVMVGLGRAVGETMIVLMAAGNTPIMELNIFNGFRTLSANIAYELPEAVRNSTHYRTLFLAALVLFIMTFLVNTVAEAVRLRFRRRVYQL